MQHDEFTIGGTFWCSGQQWRCTDIGRRTIIAIRIDRVSVGSTNPELRRTLSRAEAEAEGWFKGPPYACAETVFDEDFLPACSLEPDAEMANEPDTAECSGEWPEITGPQSAVQRTPACSGPITRQPPNQETNSRPS